MFFDRTPVVRLRTRDPWQHRLARWAWRKVWGLRVELAVLTVTVALGRLLVARLGLTGAVIVAVLLAPGLLAPTVVADWLDALLSRSRVRRRWESACRHAQLANPTDQVPTARLVAACTVGWRLLVVVPHGRNALEVEAHAETLAAVLALREVRVHRDPANARRAWVTLVQVDPFDVDTPTSPPLATAGRVSLWEPFEVATNEDGNPVALALPERNLLLGGEPGAGKSAALSLPLAAAALDPTVDVTLLDGKQVEFAVWRAIATETVGPDVDHANRVLARLITDMDRRYTWLLARGRRKVEPGDGLRLQVVAIDELAWFLHRGDRNQSREFATLLWDLVSRGRAAGIIVLAATQKPAADVVPSKLRDLFGFRWALRCATRDASDTILGAGWATLGYSAATIPGEQRGVGYLLAEGAEPVRCRSHYLTDDALAAVAARAAELRRDYLSAQVAASEGAR